MGQGNKNHGLAPAAVTVPSPHPVADAPAVSPEPALVAEKKPAGVMVENKTSTWFRQPSTGTFIHAGEKKVLQNDGWLAQQTQAGFLVPVN